MRLKIFSSFILIISLDILVLLAIYFATSNYSVSTISARFGAFDNKIKVLDGALLRFDTRSKIEKKIYKSTLEEKYKKYYLTTLKTLSPNVQITENDNGGNISSHNFRLDFNFKLNDIDSEKLKSEIQTILGSNSHNYSIYVHDIKRDMTIGINEEKLMPPGSISKVPIAILTLRDVDKGNLSLSQAVRLDFGDVADPSNALKARNVGASFTIDQYLRFLIIDSDNTSIRKLENLMGGYLVTNERTKVELGVEYFFRDPHDVSAKDMGKVFKGIYKGEYLKSETNAYLLDLLKNTHPLLQDGIPVGVPAGTAIAHKTGQISTIPGYSWEDAAIVYGAKTDYILIFLNEKIDNDEARSKIQKISKVVYDTLNQ